MNDRIFPGRLPIPNAMQGQMADGMGMGLQTQTEGETLDLVEYWRSIAKRKWSILGLVALVALITTLVVFSMRPLYRSTTVLMIEHIMRAVRTFSERVVCLVAGMKVADGTPDAVLSDPLVERAYLGE